MKFNPADSFLDKVFARVFFSIEEARPIVVRGGKHRTGTRLDATLDERQVVWMSGRALAETTTGRTELEAGTVWVPGSGGARLLLVSGQEATGVEFRYAGSLAIDYARFISGRYGTCTLLGLGSASFRAAKALGRADLSCRVEMAELVFEWFSSQHAALENQRMQLDDVVEGRLESLERDAAEHGYSLKGLARRSRCTPEYLAGRIRRKWRRPASEMLREWRARFVERLVAHSDISLAEAAERSGYASLSSFLTAFKRIHGVTPSVARRGAALVRDVQGAMFLTEERAEPFAGQDVLPVAVWGGPYFQFDGGEISDGYLASFDLAMNALTDSVNWVYTLEGEAVFEVGGECLQVQPGMLVVYPQPMNGYWRTPGGRPWRRVWIKARGPWATGAMLNMAGATGWAGWLERDAAPVVMARRWVRYWNACRGEPSLSSSRRAHLWLLAWWRCLRAGEVSLVPLLDLRRFHSRSFFGRIKTVGAYAKEIGYSRSYISRRLSKQWLGGTPAQIMRRQRLAQAAQDLRQTDLSVAEIAKRACFASSSTFIPAFRREFECTPLTYRFKKR